MSPQITKSCFCIGLFIHHSAGGGVLPRMEVIYAQKPFPTKVTKKLFLAGPTDRRPIPTAWRQEALQHLRDLGYDGHVFVPETEDGSWNGNLDAQFEWEDEGLSQADAIVFWVPRDLKTMPGFTTNIEWGLWADSGKVVWGAPEGAAKIDWAERYARKFCVPALRDLKATLKLALDQIIDGGALREGEDAKTSILNWRAEQNWPTIYPKPDLTADNVVFHGNSVLLIQRKKDPFMGQWALPGGYVNKGEETLAAAIRELAEEATLVSGDTRLVGVYGKEGRDPRGWVVSVAYTSEATSQKIKANDDAEDARWFPIDEAVAMCLAFDHNQILKDALICRIFR